MNAILNNKLVLLQTHYWLVHSYTPFALAIFYIAFYLSLFLEITNISDRMPKLYFNLYSDCAL